MTLLQIILAVLLPPVAVAMEVGVTTQFWVNLILTMFWYVPGILHAFWVISRKSGPTIVTPSKRPLR